MAKLAADLDGMTMGGLASKGRYGDTMIAHINPQEAQMLKDAGGSGTINPMTGLPEFYDYSFGGDDWSSYDADWSGMDDASTGGGDLDFDYDLEEAADVWAAETAPDAAWETGWGESDPGGPTKEQAEEAAEDFAVWSAAIDVAKDRNYNIKDPEFLQRLENSIRGNTQDSQGNNIGLTADEITDLGYYTDDPKDSRFGSYLGYNQLVGINAHKTLDEHNYRLETDYLEGLNQEFKDKGLDATISRAKDSIGGYTYKGKDATQAALGQMAGGLASLVGTMGKMMYNASSLSPTRIAFDAITGGRLMSMEKGKEGPLSLGGVLGKQFFDSPPLESLGKSIRSALGVGTKDEADEVTVDKDGTVTSASKGGENINVSGVPSPTDVIDNILNQDAMMTPDTPGGYFGTSPQTDLPTDEQFLDMTSGDITPSGDLNINISGAGMPGPSIGAYTMSGAEETGGRLDAAMNFGTTTSPDYTKGADLGYDPSQDWAARTAPDYQALADERIDDYLSTLDLNTASTLVDPATATAATATAFVDQPDRFDDGGGDVPLVRRKPRPVVSQAVDEAVEEEKPYFPQTLLPRLTESGLKTLQYVYRNDPEILQNIYNKYALPEQYSGLKALV